jgi:hypothetical protein
MSYVDLVKARASTETANRLIAELEDFDRLSKLAESLIKEVNAELDKITSDATLIMLLRSSISDVQSAINSQQLEKLQDAMGTLNNLYKANLTQLHGMEFQAP